MFGRRAIEVPAELAGDVATGSPGTPQPEPDSRAHVAKPQKAARALEQRTEIVGSL